MTEEQFIYYGLKKDKIPLSQAQVIEFINEPENLSQYVEEFFYYYDWYWSVQG